MASTDFKRSVYAHETGEVHLQLVTITHADLGRDLRYVDNNEDIVSNGQTFRGLPLEVVLPRDTDTGVLLGRLVIDNVTRSVGAQLRALDTAPSVKIDMILASDPDTIERTFSGLEITDIRVVENTVRASIGREDYRAEAFPAHNMSPSYFPELF